MKPARASAWPQASRTWVLRARRDQTSLGGRGALCPKSLRSVRQSPDVRSDREQSLLEVLQDSTVRREDMRDVWRERFSALARTQRRDRLAQQISAVRGVRRSGVHWTAPAGLPLTVTGPLMVVALSRDLDLRTRINKNRQETRRKK